MTFTYKLCKKGRMLWEIMTEITAVDRGLVRSTSYNEQLTERMRSREREEFKEHIQNCEECEIIMEN